ncbi:MAG: 50S ribosomal protein L28 [Waddliaceae bacterium]|jgi:large subunit ribosomal protein L28|nr:50S ribosomal protein L28 [Waddliaceae bacterium]MBT3578402.1 50S ribosomal protein L28 [Waddliaceae bacterium]MBT4445292.1 50S ribosomal protein L28 [Waddliaceae bacterium]MBT6928874.1 50S ribosomal protein L28 [Waddliaceae bacterium]MBT7263946.1 50S ribosomal protein L28 [Waddliaceae bacterium]
MSKKCKVTGKKAVAGNTYARRGIAKKKKGIGLNITGKTKRTFKPNTMKKRFWLPEEKRYVRIMVSAAAIRTINKLGISSVVRKMRAKGQKI